MEHTWLLWHLAQRNTAPVLIQCLAASSVYQYDPTPLATYNKFRRKTYFLLCCSTSGQVLVMSAVPRRCVHVHPVQDLQSMYGDCELLWTVVLDMCIHVLLWLHGTCGLPSRLNDENSSRKLDATGNAKTWNHCIEKIATKTVITS